MKIIRMKTNRVTNPLGFYLDTPRLSFVVSDTAAQKMEAARIEIALDKGFTDIVSDSGKNTCVDSRAFTPDITTSPKTRYYWRVTVWADNGETAVSDAAWFETAKQDETWAAEWISPDFCSDIHPIMLKSFTAEAGKEIVSARAYISGLGLYEMYLNGRKVGNEYLTPNFNNYRNFIQYQTHDVTDYIKEENRIEVMLGNGEYKGEFRFGKNQANLFGDSFALIMELDIVYADGSRQTVATDTSWGAKKSGIMKSGIYFGEIYDATFSDNAIHPVKAASVDKSLLMARLSLPVVKKHTLKPVALIKTNAGETVLDMGQNMVGWIEFKSNAPYGARILLQHGEILQEGNFYNENLRTAKAEYHYISDGTGAVIRPRFTFFGFRYVKISGLEAEPDINDFTGCVLYSDLEETGVIETGNPLINRLFLNTLWGQRGNFLDVPTDCPQRDERMGWTGDAQAFSGTACFNMDCYAFFTKYGYDMYLEQKNNGGNVPYVVPDVLNDIKSEHFGGGAAGWADAAVIIPWNVYLYYGDKEILYRQFDSMRLWVDYMQSEDEKSGGKRILTYKQPFGDWLALDGPYEGSVQGGTDKSFLATAYYAYSSSITAKAARVLGKADIAECYERLSGEIKAAIAREFFTETGRIAVPTQTGMILSLFMDIVPENFRGRLKNDLRNKMEFDERRLKTGFLGTTYLCRTLSDNGMNDIAYTLLLNEEYPGWLYEVKMGATTIWERWNSVLPDGSISDTGMNSLNHYTYGSIVEWMFKNAAGIRPVEDAPGFKKFILAPMPDSRLACLKAGYESAYGHIASEWVYKGTDSITYHFEVPFQTEAEIVLKDIRPDYVYVNGVLLKEFGLDARYSEYGVSLTVGSGQWTLNCLCQK